MGGSECGNETERSVGTADKRNVRVLTQNITKEWNGTVKRSRHSSYIVFILWETEF
jgi:hypothetical protein